MTAPLRAVNLRYFAILREQRGLDSEVLQTAAATLGGLYEELRASHGFTLFADGIRPVVNDRFCDMGDALQDGDRVTFIPPVAGG